MRRSKRRPSSSSNLLLGTLVAGTVVTCFMFLTHRRAEPRDAEQCKIGVEPSRTTVVEFDRTDPLSPRQMGATKQVFGEIEKAMLPDEKLIVSALDANWTGLATPVFAGCRPPRKASESPDGTSDRYLAKQFDRFFASRVNASVESLSKNSESKTSPIFEHIAAMAKLPDFQGSSEHRRLVVFTDGLQNTSAFPLKNNRAADFSKLKNTPYFRELLVDLTGVEVWVFYVERTKLAQLQTTQHKAFMRNYFEAQGAAVTRFTSLPE